MTTTLRRSAAAVFLAACGFAGPWGAAVHAESPASPTERAPERRAITFRTLEDAAAESVAREGVLAIYFTAPWCGWCRKMEASTFTDPGVVADAEGVSWAKVDVDAQPDIAAMFGMRGVPAVVFVNARGEYLGERPGYVTAAQLRELLATYRGQGLAPGAAREKYTAMHRAQAALSEAKSDEEVAAAVRQTIDLMGDPAHRGRRERLRHGVLTLGSRAWPTLVASLADKRLAVRAAASDLFRAAAAGGPAFDPFAEPGERAAQLAAAQRWLAEQLPPVEAADETREEAEATRP